MTADARPDHMARRNTSWRQVARSTVQLTGDGWSVVRARRHLRHAHHLGVRVRLRGTRPVVVTRGRLIVHDRVQLVSTVATLELVVEAGGTLEIGARSLVNFGCSLVAHDRITIGPRCLIGPHCMVMDTPFHNVEPERRLDAAPSEPITIGANVWLGARVIVMPGVSIGDDAAIGAGSVVTRDIPARVFAAGVPARVVRPL